MLAGWGKGRVKEIFTSHVADILYFCAANLSDALFIKVVGLSDIAKEGKQWFSF